MSSLESPEKAKQLKHKQTNKTQINTIFQRKIEDSWLNYGTYNTILRMPVSQKVCGGMKMFSGPSRHDNKIITVGYNMKTLRYMAFQSTILTHKASNRVLLLKQYETTRTTCTMQICGLLILAPPWPVGAMFVCWSHVTLCRCKEPNDHCHVLCAQLFKQLLSKV